MISNRSKYFMSIVAVFLCVCGADQLRGLCFASDADGKDEKQARADQLERLRKEVLDNFSATGRLRQGSTKIAFSAGVRERKLTIRIPDLGKVYVLDMLGNTVSELVEGRERKLTEKDLQEEIGGTGLGVHDISLQFLFWKRSEEGPSATIRGKDCLGVTLFPPDASSPYENYTVWIEREAGVYSRAIGKLRSGAVGRQIDVMSLQKVNDKWYLKSVRFVAAGFKRVSYIDFDPPNAASPK